MNAFNFCATRLCVSPIATIEILVALTLSLVCSFDSLSIFIFSFSFFFTLFCFSHLYEIENCGESSELMCVLLFGVIPPLIGALVRWSLPLVSVLVQQVRSAITFCLQRIRIGMTFA